jgi:DNA-binding MarR family transcriptional regulator
LPFYNHFPMKHEDVYELQRLYPQIFMACHTDHVRAASTEWHISSQDASILVHLDRQTGLSPRALAGHLRVAPSTLSAAIARLAKLGYLTSEPVAQDKRRRELLLTARGAEAISCTSVLNADRVEVLLSKLSEAERKTALAGLAQLARAAREMKEIK